MSGHGRLPHEPTEGRGLLLFPQLLAVSQYLQSHPAVSGISFYDKTGVSKSAVQKWEGRNHPYQLPEDLVSFLSISDGLYLKWNITLGKTTMTSLGCMHINSLATITRLREDSIGGIGTPPEGGAAFVLDATPQTYGRVCLVYKPGTTSSPEIYFQDLASSWHYVSQTFTDYFRLLISHLGLPGWCYSFTDVGLPPTTAEWFSYLSPERFQIDTCKGNRQRTVKKAPVIDLDRIADCLAHPRPAEPTKPEASANGAGSAPTATKQKSGGAGGQQAITTSNASSQPSKPAPDTRRKVPRRSSDRGGE